MLYDTVIILVLYSVYYSANPILSTNGVGRFDGWRYCGSFHRLEATIIFLFCYFLLLRSCPILNMEPVYVRHCYYSGGKNKPCLKLIIHRPTEPSSPASSIVITCKAVLCVELYKLPCTTVAVKMKSLLNYVFDFKYKIIAYTRTFNFGALTLALPPEEGASDLSIGSDGLLCRRLCSSARRRIWPNSSLACLVISSSFPRR